MTTPLFRSLALFAFCLEASLCASSHALAQYPAPPSTNANGGQPVVIHVHHHHYYQDPGSPTAAIASFYSPTYAWNYGYQPGLGTVYSPLQQNWGHLGFTGYIGEHGGGVDVRLHQFTGLVVNTVTPGSPADKMGLVPGDFILKINGTPVDSYKQVTILFEQTLEGTKPEIDFTVWNPYSRRTSEIKAIIDRD
jgi:membrane-associated protease RseP (regulator of RpoE activity)